MSDYYEGMPYFKTKILRLYHTITGSNLWFHIYYKHTKDWKNQVDAVEKNALEWRAYWEAEDLKNNKG